MNTPNFSSEKPRLLAPFAILTAALSAASLFAAVFTSEFLGLTTAFFWAALSVASLVLQNGPVEHPALRRDQTVMLILGCAVLALTPFAKAFMPAEFGAALNVCAGVLAVAMASHVDGAPRVQRPQMRVVREMGARTSWVG